MKNSTITENHSKSVINIKKQSPILYFTNKKLKNSQTLPSKKMKTYITTLVFNNWIKRLYFGSEDNKYFETQFNKACISLNVVGDNCIECAEFFADAIQHFKKYGFTRIAK